MKNIILIILMLGISVSALAQEERHIIREGNEYYKNKEYDKAELNYKKAMEINPEATKLINNTANAQYRNGLFTDAASSYENYLKLAGSKKEKADAFYNIGNSYLQAAEYDKSIQAYQNALKMDPTHDQSRYNMAVATKIKEQQQGGGGQGQQNQDKDKQNKDQNKDKNKDQNKDKGENGNSDKNEDQDKKEDKNANQPQPKENEMTREEMERFLESLQQQEKNLQEKLNKEKFKTQQRVVEKEW